MKNTLLIVLIAMAGATACGRVGDGLRRDQQEYEVVQEGAPTGTTPALGTEQAPMPALTGTNADTTTDFTLPGSLPPGQQQPGTIAGTLPSDTGRYYPRYPTDSPRPVSPRISPPPEPVSSPPITTPPPPPPPASDGDDREPDAVEEDEDDEDEREDEDEPEPERPPGNGPERQ